MFNGIIYNTGKIVKIEKRDNGVNLILKSNLKLSKKKLGISVACDGVCLTLIKVKKNLFEFFLSKETIQRSKFKNSKINDIINLELPLKYRQDISGHICQGHVDTTAKLINKTKSDKAWIFKFKIEKQYFNQLVEKASILVNGVSLTISKILNNGFQVSVIPKTLKMTNLMFLKENDQVNVEFDVLGKYINSFIK